MKKITNMNFKIIDLTIDQSLGELLRKEFNELMSKFLSRNFMHTEIVTVRFESEYADDIPIDNPTANKVKYKHVFTLDELLDMVNEKGYSKLTLVQRKQLKSYTANLNS